MQRRVITGVPEENITSINSSLKMDSVCSSEIFVTIHRSMWLKSRRPKFKHPLQTPVRNLNQSPLSSWEEIFGQTDGRTLILTINSGLEVTAKNKNALYRYENVYNGLCVCMSLSLSVCLLSITYTFCQYEAVKGFSNSCGDICVTTCVCYAHYHNRYYRNAGKGSSTLLFVLAAIKSLPSTSD